MAALDDKDVRKLRRDVDQLPFTTGARVLRDVTFVGGETRRIPHGLGRRLQGYLIIGIRDAAALGYWTDEHDNRHPDLAKYAYIVAHGMDCTADILVF